MLSINPKYQHLFFDLDHTLWDFKTNSKLAMEQTLEMTGILAYIPSFDDFFAFYEEVNDALWDGYRKGGVTKAELTQRRFAEPLAQFGQQGVDIDYLSSLYLSQMAKQSKLMDGAMELLTKLSAHGFDLHIITNGFIEVQEKKMESSGISHFFKSITMSEMVGVSKPKPAIFEYALKNSNASKSKSIMIGDDWQNDVLGAYNFGIDAIYYNPLQKPLDEDCRIEQKGAYQEVHLKHHKRSALYQLDKLIDIKTVLEP